jgi:hypothetical protein
LRFQKAGAKRKPFRSPPFALALHNPATLIGFTGVQNPKFAIPAAITGANFGFEKTLEIYDSSVDLVQKFS